MADETTAGGAEPYDEGDAWYEARRAVMQLRDVLTAAGMENSVPYLTADVNAFGRGIVNLGRVSPATTRRLARLLRAARQAMGDEAFAREATHE